MPSRKVHPDDQEPDPGIPLFWCPYCPLSPGWLIELFRDIHCCKYHPDRPLPEGDGLEENPEEQPIAHYHLTDRRRPKDSPVVENKGLANAR